MLPDDVALIVDSAINGDVQASSLFFATMADRWPHLQKAISELARAARKAPWKIKAWTEDEDTEPTSSAEEKAAFFRRILWRADPLEEKSEGAIEDLFEWLTWQYFTGIGVSEVRWKKREDGMIVPRAYFLTPARFCAYPSTGTFGDIEDQLMLDPEGGLTGWTNLVPFNEGKYRNRFLVAIKRGHLGHPTVAAPLRALSTYWLAAQYGLKWFLQYTQKFGTPYMWATYQSDPDRDPVCQMLAEMAANGYGVGPSGMELKPLDVMKGASQIPQKELIELADRQCDAFILGQTLTTDTGENGNRSLGMVHQNIRQDVIEGVCDFIGGILTRQLGRHILRLNYGSHEEAPEIYPDWPDNKDEKAMAERDEIIVRAFPGLEWSESAIRERYGIEKPKDVSDTFIAGGSREQGGPAAGAAPVANTPPSGAPDLTARAAAKRAAEEVWEEFEDSLGVPRSEMPQTTNRNRSALVQFLRARGVDASLTLPRAGDLKPSQKNFRRDKVDAIKQAMSDGTLKGGSILTSSDGYVIDGHHRWLAQLELDPEAQIESQMLGVPAMRALMLLHRMPSTKIAAKQETPPPEDGLEKIVDSMLENLTGVSAEWLGNVQPFFARLAALAESGNVSDEDLIEAVEKAQGEMPELFDRLDTEALSDALEDSMAAAMLEGSTYRFKP
ncbi:phage portal protein family protein [Haloferula luteola]